MKKYNKKNTMNKTSIKWQLLFLFVTIITNCYAQDAPKSDATLVAKRYYSGFDQAHLTYNAISSASDGKIYYVLSSVPIDEAGKVYVYDPETDQTKFLADLSEICGEQGQKTVAQGKSHVEFYENNGKLYFATHLGYYEFIDGMERAPVNLPDGYKPYPGGHFLSYDLSSGEFEDLATAPHGEGIITMSMDLDRGQIYAITWPTGYFIHYDIGQNQLKNLGKISANGEAGIPGNDYRVVCRSMFIDPESGLVYFSTAEGDVFTYNPGTETIKKVEGVSLKLDYFGKHDPTRPGSMSYNWRSIFWYSPENVAYGIHGNTGYLFRFDPSIPQVELLERITSEPSKRSGMFDQFNYGYLGFELGPDRQTIYYLTGGPIHSDGQRIDGELQTGEGKVLENIHLVTYNIPNKKYTDHGPIIYEDGTRLTSVNSIAVGPDGNIYTLARFQHNGNSIDDLVKIPNPFK